MKHLTRLFAVVIACAIGSSLNAQYNKQYLQSNLSYSKGKIYVKKTIQPIEARNIMLANDTLLKYTDIKTGESKSVEVSSASINYIKIKTGSRAGAFGLYGAGFMGLSALVGVLTAENDQLTTTGETSGINWAPFVLGFTAGGAIVGAAIGAFVPKYSNYYVKTPGMAVNVKIVPQYYYGRAAGIGLQLTF